MTLKLILSCKYQEKQKLLSEVQSRQHEIQWQHQQKEAAKGKIKSHEEETFNTCFIIYL